MKALCLVKISLILMRFRTKYQNLDQIQSQISCAQSFLPPHDNGCKTGCNLPCHPVQIASRSLSMKERIDSLESDLRRSSEGRDAQVGAHCAR